MKNGENIYNLIKIGFNIQLTACNYNSGVSQGYKWTDDDCVWKHDMTPIVRFLDLD